MPRIDTVVIGGGHAGLCMSHMLQNLRREHVVLEQRRPLEQWRSARWDSFRINSPLGYSRLMGQADGLPDARRGIQVGEMLALWDAAIAEQDFPIRSFCRVDSVARTPDGNFRIQIHGEATYEARNVVAAPGNYQFPTVPGFAEKLPADIQQFRIGTYSNPSAIQQGAILVVGGGQTGMQLCEELAAAGREVFLATSAVKGSPRTYRGEDIMVWLDRAGMLTAPRDTLPSRTARMPIVGADHAISHHSLARLGVTLLGRLRDLSDDGTTAFFGRDLHHNIAFARQGYDELIARIENWIISTGGIFPPAIPEPAWQPHAPLLAANPPAELNLRAQNIRAVVWATGWRADFPWLHIDDVRAALDPNGLPTSCLTPVEGFFWLGFDWLRIAASGTIAGFHHDAPYVAARLRAP